MKKLLIILLLISCFLSQGQQNKISFSYDSAGNQITRSYCYSCAAKNSNNLKDVSQINDSDLLKFIPDDNFSYYPNPVKEELFLTWNKQDEIILNSIKLYNLNGS